MEGILEWMITLDGRRPWIEDDLGWRMSLDGSMEDHHVWKTTKDERKLRMNDDPGWKGTLDGGGPLDGRQPYHGIRTWMEYELGWKITSEQVPSQGEAGICCGFISVSPSVLATASIGNVESLKN